MRLLAFLVFLLFGIYLTVARWYFVCELRGLCQPAVAVADTRPHTLQLTEEGRVLLRDYDEFAFDSAAVAPRLNANNQAFLDTLADILLADTSKGLTITGLYRDTEASLKAGYFENLGVARADAVRQLLQSRGIAQQRISLDHSQSSDPGLAAPLRFELYSASGIPDAYDKVAFTFKNMTFSDANFEFDSDVFKPGAPFLLYADSVVTYLSLHPEASLTIIGHTDDIGEAKYNENLGLRRAKNTKLFFQQRGVKADIAVQSMGETRPVASNSSPEGRQKNRRVNFVLE